MYSELRDSEDLFLAQRHAHVLIAITPERSLKSLSLWGPGCKMPQARIAHRGYGGAEADSFLILPIRRRTAHGMERGWCKSSQLRIVHPPHARATDRCGHTGCDALQTSQTTIYVAHLRLDGNGAEVKQLQHTDAHTNMVIHPHPRPRPCYALSIYPFSVTFSTTLPVIGYLYSPFRLHNGNVPEQAVVVDGEMQLPFLFCLCLTAESPRRSMQSGGAARTQITKREHTTRMLLICDEDMVD